MNHCSQLAAAIRGKQWLDALIHYNTILYYTTIQYNTKLKNYNYNTITILSGIKIYYHTIHLRTGKLTGQKLSVK